MAATIVCSQCSFDFASLPARLEVSLKESPEGKVCTLQEGAAPVACPICGWLQTIKVTSLGVILRGSGARATCARWKTGPRDDVSKPIKLGRFEIKIDRVEAIEPRDVCYESVPVFVDDGGRLAAPSLPVKREYFDCIDENRLAELSKKGPVGQIVGMEYHVMLPLRGIEAPVELRFPVLTPGGGAPSPTNAFRELNVRVWPAIEIEDWKHFLVGVAGAGAAGNDLLAGRARMRLAAFARSVSSPFEPIAEVQRAGTAAVRAMTERPSWVALEVTDADAHVLGGGLFAVGPAPGGLRKRNATSPLELGFDFGTSNSCVAAAVGGESPELVPRIDENQWNHYVIRGGAELIEPAGPDLWPTIIGLGKQLGVSPTEIVFPQPRAEAAARLGGLAWRFGVDFGISAANARPRYSEADYLVGDFKWSDMLRGPLAPFKNQIKSLQKNYIAALLMCAFVQHVTKFSVVPGQVTVFWSYPMCFHEEDFATLKEAMEQAMTHLHDLTGIQWDTQAGLDESAAAAATAGEVAENIHVYLDMGGGSTDIAIRMTGKPEAVYMTSVAYAGQALIDGYAGRIDPQSGRTSGSCLTANTTKDTLRRTIRVADSVRQILADPAIFPRAKERTTQFRTRLFYFYLTEYVARLLAAGILDQRFRENDKFPSKMSFAFFFLGNGWGFASQLTSADVPELLRERIFNRTVELLRKETSSYATQIKKEITTNKVQFDSNVPPTNKIPHPKAAVAYGLLKRTGAPKERQRKRGIVGWNVTFGERSIPWFAYYGTGGPPKLGGGRKGPVTLDLMSEDEPAPETAAAPWYAEIPDGRQLDCPKDESKLPDDLRSPFDLDRDLNETRRPLRAQCVNAMEKWFQKGAYEVMLEELFKPQLPALEVEEVR